MQTLQLFDMHCHLDFADNAKDVASESAGANITALSSTVNPGSFVSATEKFEGFPNIYVALGLHPWWIANNQIAEVDVERFENLAKTTHFIGEIGLDFSGDHKDSKTKQEQFFFRALCACNDSTGTPNKVIFIHAVNATTRVLDMLKQCDTFHNNTVVFHWFQGSAEECDRALKAGASFSVSARMLANDRTRALVKAIPDERLLLETDSPAQVGMIFSTDTWRKELENTLMDLANLRGTTPQNLADVLAANSLRVLQES